MARAISTRSRHHFRADDDLATAVCDCALLFASVWLSAGQSHEYNGTVAADLGPRLRGSSLLRRMRTWLAILVAASSRRGHEWTPPERSSRAQGDVRHFAWFPLHRKTLPHKQLR